MFVLAILVVALGALFVVLFAGLVVLVAVLWFIALPVKFVLEIWRAIWQ